MLLYSGKEFLKVIKDEESQGCVVVFKSKGEEKIVNDPNGLIFCSPKL